MEEIFLPDRVKKIVINPKIHWLGKIVLKSSETSQVGNFRFKDLHPNIYIGTASDRYKGWLGQIYSENVYRTKVVKRSKKVGKKDFLEEVLPVESVQEYFEHFRVLELDFTFYGPLLDNKGTANRNLHILRSYSRYLKENDRLILKVPQSVFAKKLWRKGSYTDNPDYLSRDLFIKRFYKPAVELLNPWLTGFIFEQEYQRAKDRNSPEELAEELGSFFADIPRDTRYHVELRTESFLSPSVIEVFEDHGIGQVFSHWTWLPSLSEQFSKVNGKFSNSGKAIIIRLMTPRGVRYEDAYAKAYPFNTVVEGMMSPGMIEDTVSIMESGIREDAKISVIVNNRAGGNAPIIAQRIMQQFLASREKPLDS